MMRRFPVLFGALSVTLTLAAVTARGASYTRTMEFTDATPGAEHIRAVATDSSGNVYLAGRDMGAPTKHWIARVNANGSPSWVRHSGDGFPDLIGQNFVEPYGAELIAGHLVIVGQTRTANGSPQDMGFIVNLDPSTGSVQGIVYNPGNAGYDAGFHAVSADPSDPNVAWVAGWAGSAAEGDNGFLAQYNVSPATPSYINQHILDAYTSAKADQWYSILVTPGAVLLGGTTTVPGFTTPWWARYDKSLGFQAQANHPAPTGETEGAYVGLAMAGGRLYAAVVGGTAGAYDSLDVRELNPTTGSMLGTQIVLKSNGPPLSSITRFSCGIAESPVNGRILVANFDQVWDLQRDLGLYDTLSIPSGWHVDALTFLADGRFATAGWDQAGNLGTAAVWTLASPTEGGTSATLTLDPGTFKVAPNVIELATGGFAGFHARGTAGAAFTVHILDTVGRRVGSVAGTCDGSGAALIRFHAGIGGKDKDQGWSGNSLPPGSYLAVAAGAGLSSKPKGFVVIMRRVK